MKYLLTILLTLGCVAPQSPDELRSEFALITADVRDAIVAIDDPELQDDLAELVVALDEVAVILAALDEPDLEMTQSLFDLAGAAMEIPGLPPKAVLALFAMRAVLRRVIASS